MGKDCGLLVTTTVTNALLKVLYDGPSGHDGLDAAMFWVGLLFVLTPMTVIGSVVGYLWWSRRRKAAPPDASQRTGI